MSNAAGNECSESMREMCGCVSFSVWVSGLCPTKLLESTLSEVNGLANLPFVLSHFPFYYFIFISLTLFSPPTPLLCWVPVCFLSVPSGRSFWTEGKSCCISSCVYGIVRVKLLQRRRGRTIDVAWSRSKKKVPWCKKKKKVLKKMNPHASVLYRESTHLRANPAWLYLPVQQVSSSWHLPRWCRQLRRC